jgi:Ca2+-binding EF-hand superfamily protein
MIADRIVNEADKTEDGSICFEEFQEALADLDFEGKMAFVSFS